METRVLKLEECVNDACDRLARIETRLDQTATSADMHREMTDQTWRLVTFVCGFGSALVAVTYFMATHIR
jgi:Ni,Fe-hydrogenase III large subunit